jgi:hypothetical protein
MAPVRFEALQEVFEGRMVTRGLWPPRSPDLTPRDFYVSKQKRLSPVHAVHQCNTCCSTDMFLLDLRQLWQRISFFFFHRLIGHAEKHDPLFVTCFVSSKHSVKIYTQLYPGTAQHKKGY